LKLSFIFFESHQKKIIYYYKIIPTRDPSVYILDEKEWKSSLFPRKTYIKFTYVIQYMIYIDEMKKKGINNMMRTRLIIGRWWIGRRYHFLCRKIPIHFMILDILIQNVRNRTFVSPNMTNRDDFFGAYKIPVTYVHLSNTDYYSMKSNKNKITFLHVHKSNVELTSIHICVH